MDELQLRSAMGYQQQWGIPLGRILVEKRFCSADEVIGALSLQTGHPPLRLDGVPLDPRMKEVLPLKAAERLRAVPLRVEGKRGEVLVVAVAAPCDIDTLDALRAITGKARLEAHVALDAEVERAIAALYHGVAPEQAKPEVEAVAPPVTIPAEVEYELTDVAPAVRLFGWQDTALRALAALIGRSGIEATPVPGEELAALGADDVLIASTLGLQSVLAGGAPLKAKLIICGLKDDADVEAARSLGARLYLRPPFSAEQLEGAIRQLTA